MRFRIRQDTANNPVPFDNGSYQIIEPDGQNIVTITQPGTTYSTPGTDDHSLYGENMTITCNTPGTTQVEAVLLASGPSSGSVANFGYNVKNYPAAGSVLGSVGADQYFGNVLSVTCPAPVSIDQPVRRSTTRTALPAERGIVPEATASTRIVTPA